MVNSELCIYYLLFRTVLMFIFMVLKPNTNNSYSSIVFAFNNMIKKSFFKRKNLKLMRVLHPNICVL